MGGLYLLGQRAPRLCLCFCRMGLTLHQSGHGHSHDTSQQQENPSVRAAFIHVVGDFLQSLGILVAAYILYFKVRAGDRGRWAGGLEWAGECKLSGGSCLHVALSRF